MLRFVSNCIADMHLVCPVDVVFEMKEMNKLQNCFSQQRDILHVPGLYMCQDFTPNTKRRVNKETQFIEL
jgi:hypothetical protein